MKILAFDTTNATLSTAVLFGQKVISQENIFLINQHSSMLIPSIEKCLNEAKIWYQNLDLIAFTNGPGSFTGIRVGYSAAKALAIAVDAPIVAINSLEAIAYSYLQEATQCKKILVANDARMEEFFVQEFLVENNQLQSLFDPIMIKVDEISNFLPKEQFVLAGSAKNMIKANLQNAIIFPKEDFIDAKNVALLAEEIHQKQGKQIIDQALYIRAPQISKRKK